MEEEGGDDSEMIDAMDGWDSEDDSTAQTADSSMAAGANQPADENKNDEVWSIELEAIYFRSKFRNNSLF